MKGDRVALVDIAGWEFGDLIIFLPQLVTHCNSGHVHTEAHPELASNELVRMPIAE